ncbi:MAG: thioredoxin domain-containing protein [Deltaproteobacteria bacterium]|nr:thioredoxin domain-containing protein [Deltaproteobacteria bacterium]
MATPPGAEHSSELTAELQRALAAQGPSYKPRTEHKDGEVPQFTNRLILETSPYLLQHAHNPVNWFAWGKEAFDEAKRLNRPILLSVGYATCHWCHVMERESFEDVAIACFMNEHYVCIKVDREERPDVDAIYMSAVQALHGSGGWPMTVWMDLQQRPFFAGTYFPARDGDRGTRHGFLTMLRELHHLFVNDPNRVAEAAQSLAEAVKSDLAEGGVSSALPDGRVIDAAVEYFERAFDPVHGGTMRAPKFPSNIPIRLMLRHHARTGDAKALQVATFTLEKMAAGGMHDQLGGGFHRYSTDREWLVPHFEKMLYDNAMLAVAYAEAHQVTGRADFARVTRATLEYLLAEMRSPEGAFYSATDADSEGEEGLFFVWGEDEIRRALGAEAERFIRFYGVTRSGNFEGRNILFVAKPDEDEWKPLESARRTLYAIRAKREPPLRDDKILAAWNGLAISAFAVGGRVLREPRFLEAASRAASFVLEKMRVNGRLTRSFKDGRARHDGYLDDYAFVTAGLIDLYESTFDRRWLREAIALTEEVDAHFADKDRGAWFLTRDDHEVLLAREKPNHDGAEPSGTSVQTMNALRLGELTQQAKFRESAERALACFGPALGERSIALTEMLLALEFARSTPKEIVLVWPDAELPADFAEVLARTFVPARVIAGARQADVDELAKLVPLAGEKGAQNGQATAYVCERGACKLPVTEPNAFTQQLK